jgi:hypothetical protein
LNSFFISFLAKKETKQRKMLACENAFLRQLADALESASGRTGKLAAK